MQLEAFEADVVEHLLIGRARARMFEKLADDRPWELYLDTGTMTLGERPYAVQLLGTFSHASKTFLWGWANEDSATMGPSLLLAKKLRTRGAEPGQSLYVHDKIAEGWVRPMELAYVAGEVAGGYPVFLAHYDSGYAVLLVTDARIDATRVSMAYIPGVLLELASVSFADPRACSKRFLERLGFVVREGATGLSAERGTDRVNVKLDANRIVDVQIDAGRR